MERIKAHLLLLVMFGLTLSVFGQEIITNHVIIIDNTGSMRGKPDNSGNQDIWSKVKLGIIDYIKSVDIGHKITLYNFDEDVSKPTLFDVKSNTDKINAIAYVQNLKANGQTTCLYTALNTVLSNLQSIENERKLIYVYTDFVEACPDENYSIYEIKSEFKTLQSKDYAHLYYISLGKSIPGDIQVFADDNANVYATTKMPNSEEIIPKITINSKDLVVDFSKITSVKIAVPIAFSDVLLNKTISFQLDCPSKFINLKSLEAQLNSTEISLSFEIIKAFNYNEKNKITGSLFISTTEFASVHPPRIQVTFILPTKRTSTISIR
jgi:hypothetical protein